MKLNDREKFTAAASLGLINLWDIESAMQAVDKYQWAGDHYAKGGAMLAIGISSSGVINEDVSALAILSEAIDDQENNFISRLGAIIGLGISYAGMNKEEIIDVLTSYVIDADSDIELSAMSALSLCMVFSGSCNADVASTVLDNLIEKDNN
jgi:26S proteasome regulatory subunit N1